MIKYACACKCTHTNIVKGFKNQNCLEFIVNYLPMACFLYYLYFVSIAENYDLIIYRAISIKSTF